MTLSPVVGDLDDLHPAVGPALRRLDRRCDLARLRQRRAASREFPRRSPCIRPPLVHCCAFRQRAGREMSVILGLEMLLRRQRRAALVTGDRQILAQAVVAKLRRISPMAASVPEIAARAACRDPAGPDRTGACRGGAGRSARSTRSRPPPGRGWSAA